FSRFLFAAPLGGQVLVHARLAGQGITAANNEVVYLFQGGAGWQILLRKGSSAPGCNGARVGAFQAIEVNSKDDDYAILISLTGTSTARNQALLRGDVSLGSSGATLGARRPH